MVNTQRVKKGTSVKKFIKKATDDLRAQIVYQRDYLMKVLRGRLNKNFVKIEENEAMSTRQYQQKLMLRTHSSGFPSTMYD